MFLLASSGFSFLDATAIIGIIGAIVAGLVALRKAGPEQNSIYITSAQGAAVIMDNLITTLRLEVDRGRERIGRLEADVARLEAENARLEAANQTLLMKHGERHDDPHETTPLS